MKSILDIDWEEQWAAHAPGFQEGKAHIPLVGGGNFSLLPGPGFGDASHPTTKLMLSLLTPLVSKKVVFDIGCGSGILSIAAAKYGASKVHICDTCPEALKHSQKNGELNGVHLDLAPPPFKKQPVILMNMIASEQKDAWAAQKRPFTHLITSGILARDKAPYLTFAQDMGWTLLQEEELEGWMGFIFKEKS